MAINVVPYNLTNGSKNFKKFLDTPFTLDILYPIHNEKSISTLFDGWNLMMGFMNDKFVNNNNIILEFYSTFYLIKKDVENSITYKMSIPTTINDFINDMCRFGIQLYWTSWIDENFEPQEYLAVNEIKTYFENLLEKIGKSHELL